MKINFWEKLSARIIGIFVVFMILSFIPEMEIMHKFFNDRICNIIGDCERNNYTTTHYHWGYRHWLWITMGILLAGVQIARMILFIDKQSYKEL